MGQVGYSNPLFMGNPRKLSSSSKTQPEPQAPTRERMKSVMYMNAHSRKDNWASGVGLEPTTYGLTVRRAADCATPEKTRQCTNRGRHPFRPRWLNVQRGRPGASQEDLTYPPVSLTYPSVGGYCRRVG